MFNHRAEPPCRPCFDGVVVGKPHSPSLVVCRGHDAERDDINPRLTDWHDEDAARSRTVHAEDVSESVVRKSASAVIRCAAVEEQTAVVFARCLALNPDKGMPAKVDH